MRSAPTRSSPEPAGRPLRWAGPAATASPLASTRWRLTSAPRAGSARHRAPAGLQTTSASTPSCWRAGAAPTPPRPTKGSSPGSAPPPPLPAGRHRLLGHLYRRRGRAARRAHGSRRTGRGPRSCATRIPTSPSIPTRSTSATASSGRAPASPPASTSRWPWSQDDLGVDVAQTVARWLVMFLHRPGGQTQFASPVWVPRAERSTVRAVQDLVEAAPGGDHRLPALAAAAAMSVRHFTRVFTAEVGESPSRFVERTRVEAARRRARDDGRHARRRGGALRPRQRRDTCGASSSAISASPPTPTAGGSAPPRSERVSA